MNHTAKLPSIEVPTIVNLPAQQQGCVVNIALSIQTPFPQQFSCTLQAGQVGVLLAPSGAGKTTLFNAIAGLHAAKGTIKIGATMLEQQTQPTHLRQLAYVTQSPILFNHVTVSKLLKLVSKQQKQPLDMSWAIEMMQLTECMSLRGNQLSGGQKQRVSLLLAMSKGMPLLLLDEVLTGLDQANKQATIKVIKSYLQMTQAAALIACHQIEDVLALADVAFVLNQVEDQKHWSVMPIGMGIHEYQVQLLTQNSDGKQRKDRVCASQFRSLLHVRTLAHHVTLGLTQYCVAGQLGFGVLNANLQLEKPATLILQANRVGLSKTELPQSSFVNQWLVKIIDVRSVSWQGEQGMLIDTQLVGSRSEIAEEQDILSVWITRLSFNQLQPKVNESWYLIGKADALSSC